ncbi:MAG: nitrogenase, partial [Desulfomonile tiedjei]|nr:nitrogenase [Desulfomonile tiedjei]
MNSKPQTYVSTTNACKTCMPLGACLAFRGIEGAVPFLHGSQGCATYMRRYIISHFREPMDIASSSLGEKHAVYGGGPNLKLGLTNVMSKYGAQMIGIATTCLTETIGDNVPMLVREFRDEFSDLIQDHGAPALVNVSTPSFSGTHMDGFHYAVKAAVEQLAEDVPSHCGAALLPGFVSPADTRYLKEVMEDFGLNSVVLPDISLTLDAPALLDYEKLPSGGTSISDIRRLGGSGSVIEFGRSIAGSPTAGKFLEDRFSIPLHSLGTPIGLRETDAFFQAVEEISGKQTPVSHALERGRLIDAYVDGHKYLFDQRVVVYGEEDLVIGLTAFLAEIGAKPVLCASGGRSRRMEKAIRELAQDLLPEPPMVLEGVDFYQIAEYAESLNPQLLIGNSKGYQ